LIDNFYPNRPSDLEDVCLYDFVKWYIYKNTDASGNRVNRKLNKPCLPNHRIYDPSKENEKEAYYYIILLFFIPFRNKSDLVKTNQSVEDAFNLFIASNPDIQEQHEKLTKILQAQKKVTKINEHRESTQEEPLKEEADENTGLEIARETKAAMHDVNEMEDVVDNDSLNEKIQMLNKDQCRVFDMISEHLLHHRKHELGECTCTNSAPHRTPGESCRMVATFCTSKKSYEDDSPFH